MKLLDDTIRHLLTSRGWDLGTDLENLAALLLSGAFKRDEVCQQHRVGRYRLDFAWPDIQVALEIDGWHHRSPEGAAKDAGRDSALRGAGWLVLRVDDRAGRDAMSDQLVRVCQVVHGLRAISVRGTEAASMDCPSCVTASKPATTRQRRRQA